MADGDTVADDKDVVRYAIPIDVPKGVIGLTAFERPEKDKDGLSVCQLGVLESDRDLDLREIRRILGAWREKCLVCTPPSRRNPARHR